MTDPNDPRSESSGTVSSSVIELAKQGDEQAFRRLCTLYSGLVYHWCRSAGLSPEDSEDVGQQVFLSVSRSLSGFHRERPGDSFRAWIRVITRARIADFYREGAGREYATGDASTLMVKDLHSPDDDSEGHGPSESLMLYEQAIRLIHGEFAAGDCQAFHLVIVEGLSPREVAEQLGITVNSVYIAKSRILKRLRDEFGDLLTETN